MKNYEYNQHEFERKSSRNFVKENVENIRQMQGMMNVNKVPKLKLVKGSDKFQTIPQWIPGSRGDTPTRGEKPEIKKIPEQKKPKKNPEPFKAKSEVKKSEKKSEIYESRFSHRSVQTERMDDPSKLYETGVIKYATTYPSKTKAITRTPKEPTVVNTHNKDTHTEEDENRIKDYIKENMVNLKPKPVRHINSKVPAEPPPTYQKGVLPKYLQERLAENKVDDDDACPPGHVLLPDSERKETLRVLRQSYADRIQELNGLPVRSDTLRIRKKKMAIEEELKKIDSGIKVFQRSKVYVKINS